MLRPTGPTNAKIMLVGEAPGQQEERQGVPFVGASGQELDRMLHEAGILRSECFVTNVCRFRPPDNKIEAWIPKRKKDILPGFQPCLGKIVHPHVVSGVQLLLKEIELVKPEVVIALGATPLWALTQKEGITSWRGTPITIQVADRPVTVLPTLHPSYILRQWSMRAWAVLDLKKAKAISTGAGPKTVERTFTIRPSFKEATDYLEALLHSLNQDRVFPISCDIETRARKHIACVGLATDTRSAFCIPFMCVERPEGYWSLEEELTIIKLLRAILCHPNARVGGQNFAYDAQYFAKEFGFVPHLNWDTLTAQHVLYPGTPKDLGTLSSMYCDDHEYWKEEGKEWDMNTGEEQLWTYNCKDVVRTLEIFHAQCDALAKASLLPIFEFQMELETYIIEMMLDGIRFNRSATPFLGAQLESLMQNRLKRIEHICDHPVNPSSPQQLQKLFYQDLQEKVIKSRKTGQPTLDDDAFQKIAERNPILRPLIYLILDYRSFRVFKSTFVEAPPSLDGRMRTSFNINGTYTFRLSSSSDAFDQGMNLQNLPSEETKSFAKAKKRGSAQDYPDIRKLFLPDEPDSDGPWIFWNADLDRADLQVVVWEADDTELMQLLREGADLHVENAKVLFGLTTAQEVSKGMRAFAKAFVHGTNYGGTPATMAAAAGVTVHQAEIAQRRWFQAHPGIKEWQERVKFQIQTRRMITNILGYRWVIFDRVEDSFTDALAWGPQSTVGCVINRGLVNLRRNVPRTQCKTLIQVHDSLAGICRPDFDLSLIKKNLEITLPYAKPLTIPVSVETSPLSWGDCK